VAIPGIKLPHLVQQKIKKDKKRKNKTDTDIQIGRMRTNRKKMKNSERMLTIRR
jgi:hypothetical protein